jgi:hypothetical protein
MSAVMTHSPPLVVDSRDDIDSDADPSQAKLAYFVAIFNGSRRNYSKAQIILTGNAMAVNRVQAALTGRHNVPSNKIIADYDNVTPGGRMVQLRIAYNAYSTPKKVVVSFQDDLMSIVNVEFEVSPDGAYIEEVAGQLTPLKLKIKERLAKNQLRNITFKTKAAGIAGFDRETLAKVETSLKGKIQASISAELHLPGTKATPIIVELSGWFGTKIYSNALKPIGGGGIGVSW